MNYGTLKQTVLDYAHRDDLVAHVASFISLAEGMIRRDLTAMPTSITLDDDDRVTGGVYTLPSGLDNVRAIYVDADDGTSRALEQVGLHQVRRLSATAQPQWFAVNGSTIEVRGIPAEDAELEAQYFGHPAALVADADENSLLTNHEGLYIYGALFFLYQFTQDAELAQGALDTFANTIEKLNEQAGRKLGGASVAQGYHFGPINLGY